MEFMKFYEVLNDFHSSDIMDSDVRRNGKTKSPESGNRRYHVFHNQVLRTLLLFAMVSLACLVLYHAVYPLQFSPVRFYSFSLPRVYAHANTSTNSVS